MSILSVNQFCLHPWYMPLLIEFQLPHKTHWNIKNCNQNIFWWTFVTWNFCKQQLSCKHIENIPYMFNPCMFNGLDIHSNKYIIFGLDFKVHFQFMYWLSRMPNVLNNHYGLILLIISSIKKIWTLSQRKIHTCKSLSANKLWYT